MYILGSIILLSINVLACEIKNPLKLGSTFNGLLILCTSFQGEQWIILFEAVYMLSYAPGLPPAYTISRNLFLSLALETILVDILLII